jgi:xylose isomerase
MVAAAMDIAAELGADIVSTCPLFDGYDYPFQMDYTAAWERCVDTLQRATAHRRDICLVLEYQAHEPHSHILVHDVGSALHVCGEVDAPNLGVNLDVGHALAAGDSPSEAACLLHRKGLLRYVHYNDNTGEGGDWDMISGSVHFWHWVEFLYTLRKIGYRGWLSGDIASKHVDPLKAYQTNARMLSSMCALVERVGEGRIGECIATDGGFADLYGEFSAAMVPEVVACL